MPFHQVGRYDGFDTVAEARKHYHRCRTRKSFILSDEGVAAATDLTCDRCKGPLADKPVDDPNIPDSYHGNRCDYLPKTKRVVCLHYCCAWKGTFQDVADLADVIG